MTLSSVRGILLDVDGTLTISWNAIPGAIDVVNLLRERGMPFRLLTNTTVKTRRDLADTLAAAGFDVEVDEIVTAASATAEYVRATSPGARCFLIVKGNVDEDFADAVELVEDDAEVVVIGGAEENFTYENLNRAFRMLMNGAALVTMHRNLYWKTDEGLMLDAGGFVRALEEATGVEATVVGKPTAAFFEQTGTALGVGAHEIAMVGDDIDNDALGAQAAGLKGVLVRTGKFNERALKGAAGRPDAIIDSIADLPGEIGIR